MGRFFRGLFKFFFWLLMVAVVFGLLYVFYPAVMPDDTNTVARFNLVSPYIKGLNGSWTLSMTESMEDGTMSVDMSGRFDGKLGVGFNMNSIQTRVNSISEESEQIVQNICLDSASGVLYVEKDDRWSAYSNGILSVDPVWWSNQVVPSAFSYEGSAEVEFEKLGVLGKQATVISHTYSGSDVAQLLTHLHVPFDGDIDTTSTDMSVAIYMHPFLGIPMKCTVQSLESGQPIVIKHNNGAESKILSFNLVFKVDDYSGISSVSIPQVASDLEIVPVISDMIVAEDPVISSPDDPTIVVPDDAIFTSDGQWALSFDSSGVFDTVVRNGRSQLHITSSQILTGQPTVDIYFRDKLDAYSAAKSDAVSALLYYDSIDGLVELYVNTDLLQSYVAGHTAYMYLAQYTSYEDSFVSADYVAYIELTPTQYARVVISSIVDVGVNVVLNDDYAASILDRISVIDLRGGGLR